MIKKSDIPSVLNNLNACWFGVSDTELLLKQHSLKEAWKRTTRSRKLWLIRKLGLSKWEEEYREIIHTGSVSTIVTRVNRKLSWDKVGKDILTELAKFL